MANTLPSIRLVDYEWQDANTLSGLPVGTAINIQNQTHQPVFVAITNTKPADDFEGFGIPPDMSAVATISAGEERVWLRGDGPVNIQGA